MWFRQKTFRSSFENLRTNGRPVEIIGNFSVRAEPVEAFLGFFSRIRCSVKNRSSASSHLVYYPSTFVSIGTVK